MHIIGLYVCIYILCMFVCKCVYVGACRCLRVCIFVHVYICVPMYTCVHLCMCMCMHCLYVFTCVFIWMCNHIVTPAFFILPLIPGGGQCSSAMKYCLYFYYYNLALILTNMFKTESKLCAQYRQN